MTRRSRRSDRSLVAARSRTARQGLSSSELRQRRRRNGSGGPALHPAPVVVAGVSALAVVAAWLACVVLPAAPDFDALTAVAAAALLIGYLFQLSWAIYRLPVAPLYSRLTITDHVPPRHSWTLWVLPATVPLLVAAVITPGSIPTDSFQPGMPMLGVLALHLPIFTLTGLAAVLGWMLLIAPIGLSLASFLPHRSARRSVFGRLTPHQQRWTAGIPIGMVGFGASMASVSDKGRGRSSRMAHDLRKFITLTGEPWAIVATWVFIALVVFLVVALSRSTRRTVG